MLNHGGLKHDGWRDGRHGDDNGDGDHQLKGPYYFTVNMIACDDVPIILFFHMLFILDMINMLE